MKGQDELDSVCGGGVHTQVAVWRQGWGGHGDGQRPTLNVISWDLPAVVLETEALSGTWGSLIRLAGWQAWGPPRLHLPSTGIAGVHRSAQLFTWVLGTECRFLQPHREHIEIEPSPQLLPPQSWRKESWEVAQPQQQGILL